MTANILLQNNGRVSDHGLLQNLLVDDHTQYLLIDGSRDMTNLAVAGSAIVGSYVGTPWIKSTSGSLTLSGASIDLDGFIISLQAEEIQLTNSGVPAWTFSPTGATLNLISDTASGVFRINNTDGVSAAADVDIKTSNVNITNSNFIGATSANLTVQNTITGASIVGANVTSGANPGHTHTGSSLSNIPASDITAGTFGTGAYTFDSVTTGVTPIMGSHLTTKDYVDSLVQGIKWQEPVIDMTTTPPGSPSTSDRYLITATATGDWATHEDDIAQWNGSSWDFQLPEEGFALWIEDEDKVYTYNGTAWVTFGSTVTHNNLAGLNNADFKHLTAAEYVDFGLNTTHRGLTTNPHITTIDNLSNTTITSPTNSALLSYNTTSSKWEDIDFSTFESSIDHGNLTGLSDDDHTQYLLRLDADYLVLTDDSMADTLHRHSELSASDGSPNPALSVDVDGNVGIGTTSPTAKLNVVSSATDSTLATFTGTAQSNNNAAGAGYSVTAGVSGIVTGIGGNINHVAGGGATAGGSITQTAGGGTQMGASGGSISLNGGQGVFANGGSITLTPGDFSVSGSDGTINLMGNVGIGISAPLTNLHILGNSADDTVIRVAKPTAGTISTYPKIQLAYQFVNSGNTVGAIEFGNYAVSSKYAEIRAISRSSFGNFTDGDLTFHTLGSSSLTQKMVIRASGEVGINNASPGYALDITQLATDSVVAGFRNTAGKLITDVTQTGGHGKLEVRDSSATTKISLYSNGDSYFNGGDVAIGATSAAAKLDVTSTTSGVLRLNSTYPYKALAFDSGASDCYITSYDGTNPNSKNDLTFSASRNMNFYVSKAITGSFIFKNSAADNILVIGDTKLATFSGDVSITGTDPTVEVGVSDSQYGTVNIRGGNDGSSGRLRLYNGATYDTTTDVWSIQGRTNSGAFEISAGTGQAAKFGINPTTYDVTITEGLLVGGFVGIGEASPDEVLHISADDDGNHANMPVLKIENTGTGAFDHRAQIALTALDSSGTPDNFEMFLIGGDARFQSADVYAFDNSVAIGATTAGASLDIHAVGTTPTMLQLENIQSHSVSNKILHNYVLDTSVRARTAFRIETGFTDVTDATRNATTTIYNSNSGDFDPILEVVGNDLELTGTQTITGRAGFSSFGSGTAAPDVLTIVGGVGGNNGTSTGYDGASASIALGDGGTGTFTAGDGGSFSLIAGDGGTTTCGGAGAGGEISFTTGNANTGNTGTGGDFNIITGGGASSYMTPGRAGNFDLALGAGGSTASSGGDGGDCNITTGLGGTGGSGSGGNGGDVTITLSAKGTAVVNGRDGQLIIVNIPTSDPGVSGALWSNSGVINISS